MPLLVLSLTEVAQTRVDVKGNKQTHASPSSSDSALLRRFLFWPFFVAESLKGEFSAEPALWERER